MEQAVVYVTGELKVLIVIAASVLGAALAFAYKRRPFVARIGLAAVPFLGVMVAWCWWLDLVVDPLTKLWNGPRLAPALSLRMRYSLYYADGEGPISGWIYPPVSALAYVPATFFSETPTMILAAKVLSLFFYFAPVACLLVSAAYRRLGLESALLLFIIFAFLTHESRALRYAATEVIADAPAVGLGALALVAIGCIGRTGSYRSSILAAAAATLAAWSKQLALPLLLILPLWSCIVGGFRGLGRALAITVVVVMALSLPIALIFGPQGLFFNAVTVPARHPWEVYKAPYTFQTIFIGQMRIVLVALVGLVSVYVFRVRRLKPVEAATASWVPFVIAGLLEIPMAALGYVKIGGAFNSFAHTLYPLTIAALLVSAELMVLVPQGKWLVLVATLGLALYSGLPLVHVGAEAPSLHDDSRGPRPNWMEEHRTVAAYLREHAGEVYFPWYPLEHLAVDRRAYHFEYGVYDRYQARLPVSPEQLRAYIPPHARYICYPGGTYARYFMQRLLPEFDRPVSLPGLPGCICFARSATSVGVPASSARDESDR